VFLPTKLETIVRLEISIKDPLDPIRMATMNISYFVEIISLHPSNIHKHPVIPVRQPVAKEALNPKRDVKYFRIIEIINPVM
jgi:hypothetical protein